jgi:hypothetical protein
MCEGEDCGGCPEGTRICGDDPNLPPGQETFCQPVDWPCYGWFCVVPSLNGAGAAAPGDENNYCEYRRVQPGSTELIHGSLNECELYCGIGGEA